MNCNPSPTTYCGQLYNDSCVNITGTWPVCFPITTGPCYRQSDWNTAAGNLLCALGTAITGPTTPIVVPITLPTGVTSILSSITLTGLVTPPNCVGSPLGLNPVGTTVVAEFQNIYNILCANLPIGLNTPLATGSGPALQLKCLQDPCGNPIGTLGQLLQSIINQICAEDGLVFEALLTQTGTSAPAMTILADTIDPAQANITATRTGIGQYTLTANLTYLPNGFPAGRTTVYVGTATNFTNQIIAYWQSPSVIIIQTATSGSNADGILNATSIQIEIF